MSNFTARTLAPFAFTAAQMEVVMAVINEAEAGREAGNTPTTASLTHGIMSRGGNEMMVRAVECCVSHCFA